MTSSFYSLTLERTLELLLRTIISLWPLQKTGWTNRLRKRSIYLFFFSLLLLKTLWAPWNQHFVISDQLLVTMTGTASPWPILYPSKTCGSTKKHQWRGQQTGRVGYCSGYNERLSDGHIPAVYGQTLEWDTICVCTPPALELWRVLNGEDMWRCLY